MWLLGYVSTDVEVYIGCLSLPVAPPPTPTIVARKAIPHPHQAPELRDARLFMPQKGEVILLYMQEIDSSDTDRPACHTANKTRPGPRSIAVSTYYPSILFDTDIDSGQLESGLEDNSSRLHRNTVADLV